MIIRLLHFLYTLVIAGIILPILALFCPFLRFLAPHTPTPAATACTHPQHRRHLVGR